MSAAEPVILSIGKLVAGGEGLARLDDGRAAFVAGVLPGERVRALVTESRKDFCRARLLEVLEPSPHRVPPRCPLAGPLRDGTPRPAGETCGGCDWMHIEGSFQVELKGRIVEEALRRTGHLAELPRLEASGPGPGFGYRNRVELHRTPEARAGYMAASSNRVVEAKACPVAAGPIDGLLADPSARMPPSLDRFTVFSDGTWLAIEGIDDDRELAVEVAGRRIRFAVGCFFQSNLAVLGGLAAFVESAMSTPPGPGARAADLYSGVGLFAAIAASRYEEVVAVEASARSASFIRANAPARALEVLPMTVEQWIESGAATGRFDLVIADPPRAGLSEPVRQWLARSRPPSLIYVSCGPVTLARDLGELARAGFMIEEVRLFDFYPQTSHVEAVAVLSTAG